MDMPNLSTDSSALAGVPERTFKESIGHAAYEEAGIGPEDVDVAEVYDLSTALELDWYEDIGLCGPGEAEKLLRDGATERTVAAESIVPGAIIIVKPGEKIPLDGDVVAGGLEERDDQAPRRRVEPESGNQDDLHAATVGRGADR